MSNKIQKDKTNIENGIEWMIARYLYLKNVINNHSAYTEEETKNRLDYMKERNILEGCLRFMDILPSYIKDEDNELEII